MKKREAEEHLIALRPKPAFTPSIRKTPSPPLELHRLSPSSPVTPTDSVLAALPDSPGTRRSPSILQPATPTSYNFRFAAGREFKDKFERLAEVLAVTNPLRHMAEVLEHAVDLALDKKDLKRKLERRKEREAKRRGKTSQEDSRPDEIFAREKYAASVTLPQRFKSACTPAQAISASSRERMGRGVVREPDSR